ncbi:MAG: peroxiredoxin [Eubacteriales bacterium]|nr:peroxiredoxin [Eubacteriales bacterium]
MEMKVGQKAPDFTLTDQKGNEVALSDYRGKKVLLSWHPFAFTGVCTDQMRALETHKEEFDKLNTVALGMSTDPSPSKGAWAKALSIKNTKLLSDFYPHGKVAREYGLFVEEMGSSGRANVLVDEEGIVRWVKVYDIPQLPDIQEVLNAIRDMG